MRVAILFSLLLILSCSPQGDRIFIPEVNQDFYSRALARINNDLKGNENNLALIEQKIYYCDQLDWPTSCISALDDIKNLKGMTPVLLDQYITYYSNHARHQLLYNVVDRWSEEFGLEQELIGYKITAATRLSRREESAMLLRNYMKDKSSFKDVRFASEHYLELGDTVMATYYLGKLQQMDSTDAMLFDHYAHLLIAIGQTQKGLALLEKYAQKHSDNFQFHRDLSAIYEDVGQLQKARHKLSPFQGQDTVIYKIADLYIQDDRWDSAHHVVDKIITRDSVNRKAWWWKARAYEEQGWLSYSLNYFDHLIYLNPDDTLATKRAQLVRRKIAYLQRLKFEASQIPLPVIKSKTIKDNE